MESLVPVRKCALGLLIHCLADLFPQQQLPGMSTQIHDEAKQRCMCAGFIIYLNETKPVEGTGRELIRPRRLWIFTALEQLSTSLLPLNVKA